MTKVKSAMSLEALNAMLLNGFLKEHRTVQELKVNAAKQEDDHRAAKQIEALTANTKVSAQLEAEQTCVASGQQS
jgi:hypothetical protein